MDARTDRREGRNSYVDFKIVIKHGNHFMPKLMILAVDQNEVSSEIMKL